MRIPGADTKSRVNISVKLRSEDLPLCCPMPNTAIWDMHPKVYLAMDHESKAVCPYCDTHYYLVTEES